MKILVAGVETARLLTNLREGLTALGHEVDTCLCANSNPFYGNLPYTRIIKKNTFVKRQFIDEHGRPACEPTPEFYTFVEPYDVIIFVTCLTLLPALLDLPLLKALGKKIIVRGTGSDLRFPYPGVLQWNWFNHAFPVTSNDLGLLPSLSESYADPQNFMSAGVLYKSTLAAKLYLTSMVTLYADVLCSGPAHTSLVTSPFFVGINVVNPQGIQTKIWGRPKPIILHAPSNSEVKNSAAILAALDDLQREGVDFELVQVQKIPNGHLKKFLYTADIVVDELACGGHGILANESMLSGCVVLGPNEPACEPLPRNRPVIPLRKESMHAVLRRAILDLPFRKRVAEWGVEYVSSGLHSAEASARYTLKAMERAQNQDYDYYPTLLLDAPFLPAYQDFIEKIHGVTYPVDALSAVPPGKEAIPEHVSQLLVNTMMRHGVPPQWDGEAFARSGLTGAVSLPVEALPRWDLEGAQQVNPWLWLGRNATYGYPDEGSMPHAQLAEGLEP